MGNGVVQHHSRLNKKQLALLHIVYRFRFATTELVARYQGRVGYRSVYPRLQFLVAQGYLGRSFKPADRLKGKPATYFLLGAGLGALREREGVEYSEPALHATYRDKTASEEFIERNLLIFELYCNLKKQYGDRVQFFTKSDLATHPNKHFPQPLPDAYIRLETIKGVKQYFLDVHADVGKFFVSGRRIKQYAEHADSGVWEKSKEALPNVLALCDTSTMQQKLQRRIVKESHPRLHFLLTTKAALKSVIDRLKIWQPADKPSELVNLEEA